MERSSGWAQLRGDRLAEGTEGKRSVTGTPSASSEGAIFRKAENEEEGVLVSQRSIRTFSKQSKLYSTEGRSRWWVRQVVFCVQCEFSYGCIKFLCGVFDI